MYPKTQSIRPVVLSTSPSVAGEPVTGPAAHVRPSAPQASGPTLFSLEDVLDLVGTPWETTAVNMARSTLMAATQDRTLAHLQVHDPKSAIGLEYRLYKLTRRDEKETQRAAAMPPHARRAAAQTLRQELKAFAQKSFQPTALRLYDPHSPAGQAANAFEHKYFNTLRLMRIAAAHMLARDDLSETSLGFVGEESAAACGDRLLKISMLALSEMFFEKMGGDEAVPLRQAWCDAYDFEAFVDADERAARASQAVQAQTLFGPARMAAFAELSGQVLGLGPVGRLRLREATYARLMGRQVPAILCQADGASVQEREAQAKIAQTADRLATLVGRTALTFPTGINACLHRVYEDLRLALVPEVVDEKAAA